MFFFVYFINLYRLYSLKYFNLISIYSHVNITTNLYDFIYIKGLNGRGKTTFLKDVYGGGSKGSSNFFLFKHNFVADDRLKRFFFFKNPFFFSFFFLKVCFIFFYIFIISGRAFLWSSKYFLHNILAFKYFNTDFFLLSKGQTKMVFFIMYLQVFRLFWHFDEFLSGLDFFNLGFVFVYFYYHCKARGSVFLVSHDLFFVEKEQSVAFF